MKKSSFKYWFAHWCAFQTIAFHLKCWTPKCLLHDWEKPWLKLFFPYEKVREIHRKYSRHHTNSPRKRENFNYIALVIDWECGRYTKPGDKLTAREYFEEKKDRLDPWDRYQIGKTLDELGL